MLSEEKDSEPMIGAIATEQERVLARRSFSGLPGQVSVARRWLAEMIDGFAAADEVLLVCSELATNAIMHSDSGRLGGQFTVRLAIRPDIIRLEVLDEGGPWLGRLEPGRQAEDASQCGRGFTIVAAIADAWGIAGDHEGRTAWCEIRSD